MKNSSVQKLFKGRKILVTGGTGSIGEGIVTKLLRYEPKVIRVFSNDEAGLFSMRERLHKFNQVRFLLGDVRDKQRIRRAVEEVDIIFHAAALKHVPLCEYNPFEAVQTNVLGTQNVVEAALEEEVVEQMVTISTDKAAHPENVMGTTKLLAERLTVAANYIKGSRKTLFYCVRFGNVLGSRGSALPVFFEQIVNHESMQITDSNMTRFIITLPKAIDLLFRSMSMAKGAEIFVFKMGAVRISDLAETAIEELAPLCSRKPDNIKIKFIGRRLGEKLHEELLTENEVQNALENEEMFIILPDQSAVNHKSYPGAHRVKSLKHYTSANTTKFTKDELRAMIREAYKEIKINHHENPKAVFHNGDFR